MKYIDLSREINDEIRIFPGDTPAYLKKDKSIDTDQYNSYRLEIGMHTGTHIDAPMHITRSSKFINEYGPEKFCGITKLIDARNEKVVKYRKSIDAIVNRDDIVLFYTGHDSKYDTEEYFNDHPVLDLELAEFLVSKKIKMIGIDTPSPDAAPYPVHKILLDNEIMIIENLTNLDMLIKEKKIEVYAFPLNIKADSSIVRVIAGIS